MPARNEASDPFTGRTFTLSIQIGNAAMQDGYDVAEALRTVASRVEGLAGYAPPYSGSIYDTNGNKVGRWAVGK